MFFYLKFLKYARTFRIILIPITTPSNTAIPVLNERMIASALLVAGASGANISRVVAVMAFFEHGSHLKASFYVRQSFLM